MSLFLRLGRSIAIVVVLGLAVFAHDASASNYGSWGSWGSSRGSSGSWGSSRGGFFAGRAPVRNLLGRIGNRIAYRGSYGSGGSVGWGSSGGGYSTGHWRSSRGSWGGSSGGYSYASTGSSYGSWGSSGATYVTNTAPVFTNDVNCPSCAVGGSAISSGVPMQSYPMGTEVPFGTVPASPGVYDSPIYDSTPADTTPGLQTPSSEGLDSNPIDPPSPSPADDEETSIRRDGQDAVLTVNVPEDARVYINGKRTSTPGTERCYVSRRLKPGKEYAYRVKVVVERDGKELEKTKTVKLSTGLERMVAFNFEQPAVTTLTLNVPEEAKVVLCGSETSAVGRRRHYRTKSLTKGQVWDDYQIEVTLEKDGKQITRTESIKIVGGEVRTLDFDFSAEGRIAAN